MSLFLFAPFYAPFFERDENIFYGPLLPSSTSVPLSFFLRILTILSSTQDNFFSRCLFLFLFLLLLLSCSLSELVPTRGRRWRLAGERGASSLGVRTEPASDGERKRNKSCNKSLSINPLPTKPKPLSTLPRKKKKGRKGKKKETQCQGSHVHTHTRKDKKNHTYVVKPENTSA